MSAGVYAWHEGEIVVVVPPRHKRLGGRVWQRIVRTVVERDRGLCHLCLEYGADTADHLVNLADGGTNSLTNLKAAHRLCNLRKNAARTHAIRRQRRA